MQPRLSPSAFKRTLADRVMAVARRVSFPGMLFYHYNSDKGKIIRPERAWSVRDLKEAVREKENLDKSESARLRVVYQGNELGDRQLLTVSDRHLSMRANRQKNVDISGIAVFLAQDCNFQEASTVHILKSGRQREGSQATRGRPAYSTVLARGFGRSLSNALFMKSSSSSNAVPRLLFRLQGNWRGASFGEMFRLH